MNIDLEQLKQAALAATPQDFDSAQDIKRENGWCECPTCGGEGSVESESDYCNYDNEAVGVQFYGIGNAHGAAERYYRAANPAAVLELIDRLERAEAAAPAPHIGEVGGVAAEPVAWLHRWHKPGKIITWASVEECDYPREPGWVDKDECGGISIPLFAAQRAG
jgi:hypothetical protein